MSNQRVQQFRESLHQPKTVTAPSGMKYKVRRLTAMDYIKDGLTDIPNDFFQFIVELTTGQNRGLSPEEEKKNLELFEKYLSLTVSKGVVDPPTLLRWDKEKEDTHLLWGEIPPKDQEYIIGCITGRIEDEEAEQQPEKISAPVDAGAEEKKAGEDQAPAE